MHRLLISCEEIELSEVERRKGRLERYEADLARFALNNYREGFECL
jgi:hypothetical protein